MKPFNVHLLLLVLLIGCSSFEIREKKLTVYVYPRGNFSASKKGDAELRKFYKDILDHVGNKGPYGEVGIGIVYPYLTWLKGEEGGPYVIPKEIKQHHERFIRVAKEMKLPVLVQFNGGPWHSPRKESPFLTYWKTVEGGRYLSRYKDGKVNFSISKKSDIPKEKIAPFLDIGPYQESVAHDSLFLTLSPFATKLRNARIEALDLAVSFWSKLDKKYPGVIKSFSTDSEVSNFSFRYYLNGDEIPIGYEDFVTVPFCEKFLIKNCQEFLAREKKYDNNLDLKWHKFRSDMHRKYSADTVGVIKKYFGNRTVYTHQIPRPQGEYLQKFRNRDYASPLETAVVDGAIPGYTFYIYGRRDKNFFRLIKEISTLNNGKHWGMLEFNPGKQWQEGKSELEHYTHRILSEAYKKGVRVVAPLSWIDHGPDDGIRGSGVDSGLKKFILEGPLID